jgi:phospholipid/cholesterol/gamma-HCH transport system substrate-binding protein
VIKQAPSVARIALMAAFTLSCFAALLYLWVSFGGSIPLAAKGYRVKVDFPEAVSLAQNADVRISGVPVGHVVSGTLGPGNTTAATIELKSRYAPLARDARAILRQKTLLGETYVELSPGTRRPGNYLADGGTLAQSQVSPTVQLDEIFRAFNPATRNAFQTWMQAQAGAGIGRGADLNAALGNLPDFTDKTTRLLEDLNAQQGAVRRLVSNTGVVFDAITQRQGALRNLISASNEVFRVTAQRNRELAAAFVALPTFERESSLTLDRLTRFSETTKPLVDQLQPVAQQLSPTLEQVRVLVPDLHELFARLGPLIDASRAGLPALQRFLADLRPLLGQVDPFLRNANPVFQFLGLYKRELTAFFANVVASTEAKSPPTNGHPALQYLRTENPLTPLALTFYPHIPGLARENAYQQPGAFDQLSTGLPVFDSRSCLNANPAPPTSSIPDGLVPLIQQYVFRSTDRNVPAPACKQQSPFAGGTQFPQLRASP